MGPLKILHNFLTSQLWGFSVLFYTNWNKHGFVVDDKELRTVLTAELVVFSTADSHEHDWDDLEFQLILNADPSGDLYKFRVPLFLSWSFVFL